MQGEDETMNKTMTTLKLLVPLAVAAFGLAACGGTEDGPKSLTGTPTNTADAGENGLSQAFQQQCARCHGERGEGSGNFPRVPGRQTEETYLGLVRAGRNQMPAFTVEQISDVDLRSDYLWLTTKR